MDDRHEPVVKSSAEGAPTRIALFVFIDAFGWELMKQVSFLDDELSLKQPLESVFGYSSTCDPTIITGLMPEQHGHFSFFYYAPKRSPFRLLRILKILPKSFTSRGRVRHWISKLLKRFYGFTGYFQIYNFPFDRIGLFDYSEKRDIYEPGGINEGQGTIFDELRRRGIPYHLSDWRASERTNLDSLKAELEHGRIRFAYLYMAAMDAILHAEGKGSTKVRQKIVWYEAELRSLLAAARKHYDEVAIYLFSDHGMTDITETCDLKARVEATGLEFGKDYAAVFDSTMARFWFLSEGSRERIVECLEKENRGRILSDDELHRFGCRFSDRRYGELFFLLNPGVLLCPSDMGEKPLAGMHGYDPADKDTFAAFASNQQLLVPPKRLNDLYKLMKSEVDAARV